MGFALAQELANKGARVILLTGPVSIQVNHPLIEKVDVVSGEEMYQKAVEFFPQTHGAIMCAAVADYRAAEQNPHKIKRKTGKLTLELIPNPDIAARLGEMKKDKQVLAGFALETHNELDNAQNKLQKKNLDFIVLNSLNDVGAGFQTDTNKITILDKYNKIINFELKHKNSVASDIVNYLMKFMQV